MMTECALRGPDPRRPEAKEGMQRDTLATTVDVPQPSWVFGNYHPSQESP